MAHADVESELVPTDAWRSYGPETELSSVLEAALDEFIENGYHGTTVRKIAHRASLSVPGLYYHASSKQALLVDLLRNSIEDILARSRAAVQSVGDDPAKRLAVQVENVVLYMTHRRRLSYLSSEIRNLDPEIREPYLAMRDEQERMILDAVVDGVESGIFSTQHPADATRAIIVMSRGVSVWYSLAGPLEPAEVARRYVEFAQAIVGYRGPEA